MNTALQFKNPVVFPADVWCLFKICSYSNPYMIAMSIIFRFVFSKSSMLDDNFLERIYVQID